MPAARRILVLAGTAEAAELARHLAVAAPGAEVVVSFAGLSPSRPELPGRVRVGGFGGPAGLAAYLRAEAIGAVVDATHPFAARMRWHAAEACAAAGVTRVRLERPPWVPTPGDRWEEVANVEAAAGALGPARRVFLTIGRRELAPFAALTGSWYLVRSITPPSPMPLASAEVLLARGPFTVDGERELLRSRAIDAVVTKNSGGPAAQAKLAACRELGIRVVVVRRPPSPAGPHVGTVEAALAWVLGQGQRRGV